LALHENFQMFWLNFNKHLSWCSAFRKRNLHVDILNGLTPVVLVSLATVEGANLLINFLLRHVWLWYIVALWRLLLLWCWLYFYRLWLIFCLLNFHTLNIFNLRSSSSFELCFLCVLLKLIPALCQSFAFGRELFFMLVLVLFVELINLLR
jgi:hypothetical protein